MPPCKAMLPALLKRRRRIVMTAINDRQAMPGAATTAAMVLCTILFLLAGSAFASAPRAGGKATTGLHDVSPVLPDCGSGWVEVDAVNPCCSPVMLSGVAAVSADHVWAVGSYQGINRARTLVEFWNGSDWTVVASPNWGTYSDNYLSAVAVVGPGDVWAVGKYYN